MSFEIKHRWTDAVIFSGDYKNALEAVSAAIKKGADLTGAVLTGAVLTDADLTDADLTRAVLTGADLTGAVLTGAVLTDADLTDADLTDAVLTGAVLTDADLTGADLTGAVLTRAVLTRAVLTRAVLTRADFGFTPDPTLPIRVAQQISSAPETLDMGVWHKCDTVHCLAGWAIHLSGPAGYALEAVLSAPTAGAMLIPSAAHLFYAEKEEAEKWAREILAKQPK